MFTDSLTIDFFPWLVFSAVLVWALWMGLLELTQHDPDGEENIQFFPEEVGTLHTPQTRPSEPPVPREERGQDRVDNGDDCATTVHSSDEHEVRDASGDDLAAQTVHSG